MVLGSFKNPRCFGVDEASARPVRVAWQHVTVLMLEQEMLAQRAQRTCVELLILQAQHEVLQHPVPLARVREAITAAHKPSPCARCPECDHHTLLPFSWHGSLMKTEYQEIGYPY